MRLDALIIFLIEWPYQVFTLRVTIEILMQRKSLKHKKKCALMHWSLSLLNDHTKGLFWGVRYRTTRVKRITNKKKKNAPRCSDHFRCWMTTPSAYFEGYTVEILLIPPCDHPRWLGGIDWAGFWCLDLGIVHGFLLYEIIYKSSNERSRLVKLVGVFRHLGLAQKIPPGQFLTLSHMMYVFIQII